MSTILIITVLKSKEIDTQRSTLNYKYRISFSMECEDTLNACIEFINACKATVNCLLFVCRTRRVVLFSSQSTVDLSLLLQYAFRSHFFRLTLSSPSVSPQLLLISITCERSYLAPCLSKEKPSSLSPTLSSLSTSHLQFGATWWFSVPSHALLGMILRLGG